MMGSPFKSSFMKSPFKVRAVKVRGQERPVRYITVLTPSFVEGRYMALMREMETDSTRLFPIEDLPCIRSFDRADSLIWAKVDHLGFGPASPDEIEIMEEWFHERLLVSFGHELDES